MDLSMVDDIYSNIITKLQTGKSELEVTFFQHIWLFFPVFWFAGFHPTNSISLQDWGEENQERKKFPVKCKDFWNNLFLWIIDI